MITVATGHATDAPDHIMGTIPLFHSFQLAVVSQQVACLKSIFLYL